MVISQSLNEIILQVGSPVINPNPLRIGLWDSFQLAFLWRINGGLLPTYQMGWSSIWMSQEAGKRLGSVGCNLQYTTLGW